jgi:methylated-DNA-[protein]-cysteine S-methyltransferase
MKYFYWCFKTAVGRIGIIFTCNKNEVRIIRVTLPLEEMRFWIKKICPGMKEHDCPQIARVKRKIVAYLRGEVVRLPLDLVDWSQVGHFQKRVLLMEYRIPRGMVSAYGRLAKKLGNPGAARAVGNALARNPFPLLIPCHRAVRSDRSLGGYRGGVKLKKRLLEMEGVRLERAGRVVNNRFW